MNQTQALKVGDLRPSQILFPFGVGALLDLPNFSALVMGLNDWDTAYCKEIGEERLLAEVKRRLGPQVNKLYLPPMNLEEDSLSDNPFTDQVGIPVVPYPRWVRCPRCGLLAALDSGLFTLKSVPFHPDRTRYVHSNCNKANEPTVVPVRFLLACRNGHLDEFPWVQYVHGGASTCQTSILRLRQFGVSGEASDIEVRCDTCHATRRLGEAVGPDAQAHLPACRGRHPHLRTFEEDECTEPAKVILLGASNSWFPLMLSALYIPRGENKLARLVEENWALLKNATQLVVLQGFRAANMLPAFAAFSDEEIWAAIEKRRQEEETPSEPVPADLKTPEWEALSHADVSLNSDDFKLRAVKPPPGYEHLLEKVVLVERLREVRALLGYTRVESPGDFTDAVEIQEDRRAPLSRGSMTWVPASEVRGEGIFLHFREDAIAAWQNSQQAVKQREKELYEAHRQWRLIRHIEHPEQGFPGIRYVLLHSFAHALMREVALEAGYTQASIRERIYSRSSLEPQGPWAGVLIYTAAPDSEGTLGGLVRLGEPAALARHIEQALEQMRLCASDPLCAEHLPGKEGVTVHGAACHACLFAPETACERGNKYLDRSLLVHTFSHADLAFFE